MLLHDTEVLVSAWSFGWQRDSIIYSNVASSEFRKIDLIVQVALAPMEFYPVGQPPRGFQHRHIEQRGAHFQRSRHTGPIHLRQIVVRQLDLKIVEQESLNYCCQVTHTADATGDAIVIKDLGAAPALPLRPAYRASSANSYTHGQAPRRIGYSWRQDVSTAARAGQCAGTQARSYGFRYQRAVSRRVNARKDHRRHRRSSTPRHFSAPSSKPCRWDQD